jgi:hypothetical protein
LIFLDIEGIYTYIIFNIFPESARKDSLFTFYRLGGRSKNFQKNDKRTNGITVRRHCPVHPGNPSIVRQQMDHPDKPVDDDGKTQNSKNELKEYIQLVVLAW